ncbi:MAG: hypothetical protein KGN35_07315 [Betaproteobacteria bacterium]|nr:hypothetical protein [Betaproteobacteria bacterium]
MFIEKSNSWKLILHGISFCLLILSNSVTGYSQTLFTGSFLADSRPDRMMYLVLTQTKDSVSGSLIIVTPDNLGNTKSRTLVLQGTTDGDAVTLISTRLLDDSVVISGRKRKDKVMLLFPTDSGEILNIAFLPVAEDRYNHLLKQWQEELTVSHVQKQRELNNIQNEKQKLTKLANALSEGINTVKCKKSQDCLQRG